MKLTHPDMVRLESTMQDASRGLRCAGVPPEKADDLRTLEYIISVIRMVSSTDMTVEEDRQAALETIYDGLFR